MKFLVPILITFALCAGIQAQNLSQSALTIDKIMQGEDFVGYSPERISWSENGEHIYFSWNPEADTLRATYKVNINSKNISKLSTEELKNRGSFGEYTKNYSHKVYDKNGDLFLMDMSNYTIRQITNTNQYEYSPTFSSDEQSIIYQEGDNLYTWEIATGTTTQITDFQKGEKRKDRKQSEQDQWLENDQ